MFVRRVEDLAGTDKEMLRVDGDKKLQGRRLLTKADGCGFSFSDVRISAGMSTDLHYKNHVEGNLIVAGEMELTELSSGNSWTLGRRGPLRCRPEGPAPGHGQVRCAHSQRVLPPHNGQREA